MSRDLTKYWKWNLNGFSNHVEKLLSKSEVFLIEEQGNDFYETDGVRRGALSSVSLKAYKVVDVQYAPSTGCPDCRGDNWNLS